MPLLYELFGLRAWCDDDLSRVKDSEYQFMIRTAKVVLRARRKTSG